MIGTIAGAVIGVTGFGLMMGGGFMTYKEGKNEIKIGAFNNNSSDYWKYIDAMRKSPIKTEMMKKAISAADMVIAGSVLFSIFTVVAIGSGILWFLKRSE